MFKKKKNYAPPYEVKLPYHLRYTCHLAISSVILCHMFTLLLNHISKT